MASFTITPLTDHTAAEVVDLDFTRPVDADVRSTLIRAFAVHHVLVMRDQHFTPQQFVAAAYQERVTSRFGRRGSENPGGRPKANGETWQGQPA